jgi:hypothetical protein
VALKICYLPGGADPGKKEPFVPYRRDDCAKYNKNLEQCECLLRELFKL